MPETDQKEGSPKLTWADLLPHNIGRRKKPYLQTSVSAPSSANLSRQNDSLRASLRTLNVFRSEDGPDNIVRRDCVAWQTVSQHLTLQLEQRRRSKLADGRYKDQDDIRIDNTRELKAPWIPIDSQPSYLISKTTDSAIILDENTIEDGSLLETDVHLIPMENLVNRFSSDLNNGLTDDMVTQHHAKFGYNKLTPSRPSSLLWMFIKELLVGFNGILWIATLFSFLSYVSDYTYFFLSKLSRKK